MAAQSVVDLCHFLLEKDLNVAFAESASTGRFIYEFTTVPKCGNIIQGSIVCYDISVKEKLLGVPKEAIEQYTAESAEVTQYLAAGLQKLIPADIIIAVTGLASPGGTENPDKPVGTMFVHGFIRDKPLQERLYFEGSPDEIIKQTIDKVAAIILKKLQRQYQS